MTEQNNPDVFTVPQTLGVIGGVLLLACGAAWLTAWFYRGGMYTAGTVMLVVFVPMLYLLWFILYMKPSDTRILVGEDGLVIEVPPYCTVRVSADSIRKAYRCDMRKESHLQGLARDTGTSVGGYKAGIFKAEGREAVIVSRRRDVICLVTDERLVALGPRDLSGLAAALERRLGLSVA
ncbi:hypothetical protein dsx2_2088 [Desulfovibrio sp. X2]|uniref:PH domain-containing protein n=1 Tax=Desulfovibrio sp. X2 TaxID=941449 RepID=UPI0003588937|nr:PH domain-containing protein [Desulfovibrio sp. X2]EPR43661.1 hypothetical protein dsx2_2088 [Desulfovibrio sp. X2]